MANEKIVPLKIDTGDSAKSVKELRDRLKELKDELVSTEKGTEAYSKAMTEAANIQHELKDMQAELNASAMDFGQIAGNCTNAVKGMVGGLQSAQAIMTLFGAESEDVAKAIQKMQASMALIQGITAMESGIKSFRRLSTAIKNSELVTRLFTKATQANSAAMAADAAATTTATVATQAFKAALISTGIGAIVVALGSLAAILIDVATNMDDASDATGRFESHMESLDAEIQFHNKLLAAQGASTVEQLTSEIEGYATQIDEYDKKISDMEGRLRMGGDWAKGVDSKKLDEYRQKRDALNNEKIIAEAKKATQERKDAEEEAAKAERDREKAAAEAKRISDANRTKRQQEAEKEANDIQNLSDKYKELLNTLNQFGMSDVEKQLDDLATKESETLTQLRVLLEKGIIDEDEYKTQFDAVINMYNKMMADIEAKAKSDEFKDALNLANNIVDGKKSELDVINEQIKQLQDARDLDVENASIYNDAINELELKRTEYFRQQQEERTLLSEEEAQKRRDALQTEIGNYTAMADSIGSVLDSVASAWEDSINRQVESGKISQEEGKKQFEYIKGLQITLATIQMITGIATALSGAFTTKSGPWDIALAAAQATAIAASSGAQIAKIAQTQFGGNSSASAATSVNTSSLTTLTSPVQYTSNVNDTTTNSNLRDMRVYVTESDITSTQRRVSVRESENRY